MKEPAKHNSELALVSIMLPYKNADEWINECIQSIVNQSYTNWELLCVNDQSTDQTEEIISEWQGKYAAIKMANNVGVGIANACHTALQMAKGQYLTRMDADDVMSVNKLHELVKAQGNRPGVISTGNVRFFATNGFKIGVGTRVYEQWLNKLNNENTHWQHVWRECVIANPCWMLLVSDARRLQLFACNRYPEDYDMVLTCFAAGFKVCASKQVLHLWRHHGKRTSLHAAEFTTERFFELKVFWLQVLHKPNHVVVLGTGKKAKLLIPMLLKAGIQCTWACTHYKQEGNLVLGLKYMYIHNLNIHGQLIISTLSGYEDYSMLYEKLNKEAQVLAWC